MTLNELAYNVLNKLSGGRSTNNSYISLDQIKFNINYYRSLLLHRDLTKSQLQDDYFYQEIDVDIEASGTNKIFVSTNTIPDFVHMYYQTPARIYMETSLYPLVTYNLHRMNSHARATKDARRSYMLNNKLYVYEPLDNYLGAGNNEQLNIRAIFENPTDAYVFNGIDIDDADDLPYPISGDLAQRVSQSLINGDFELFVKIPADITTDNLPNLAQ
jgi:hypothetical protein